MNKFIRRAIKLTVAAVLIFVSLYTVCLANTFDFIDFPVGWSKEAMEAAVANGLLNGYETNEIKPEECLTRAELAAILTRAFGAEDCDDISAYIDVPKTEWYYEAISKAVKMGALNGVTKTEMAPERPVTREEVFTAVARILLLESDDTAVLDKFNDKDKISSWALPSVTALAEREYLSGDENGNLNPDQNITREEFAQFMHNAISTYIKEPGKYSGSGDGIIVVRAGGVELEGFSNAYDVIIGDGVLNEEVSLLDCQIEGRVIIRGGKITFENTFAQNDIIVNNVNGVTDVFCNEETAGKVVQLTKVEFFVKEQEQIPPVDPPIDQSVQMQEIIDEAVNRLYEEKSYYLSKLDEIEAEVLGDYYSMPPEERDGAKQMLISKYLPRVAQWESQCDAVVYGIINELRATLESAGKDTQIADDIEFAYLEEKKHKKEYFINLYMD